MSDTRGLPIDERSIYTGAKGKLMDADGLPMQEVQEFDFWLEPSYGDVPTLGTRATGQKLLGYKVRGTFKKFVINTTLERAITEAWQQGEEYVTSLVGQAGNDQGELQRVQLIGVKFTGQVSLLKSAAQQMTERDQEISAVDFRWL